MKKKKYLPVYKNWINRSERNHDMYLCNKFRNDELVLLFEPTDMEFERLYISGYSTFAWAEGNVSKTFADYNCRNKSFPPLRRNILLFLAAMNNEL